MREEISQIEFENEVKRISENNHRFLQYFGIFWGAMLLFILQSNGKNNVAEIIQKGVAEFYLRPFSDNAHLLGFFLITIGAIYIFASLITLTANAVSVSALKSSKEKMKEYIEKQEKALKKSVLSGILGTICLLILFVLTIFYDNKLPQYEQIGYMFTFCTIVYFFFIDPIAIIPKRKENTWHWIKENMWHWINLFSAYFLGFIFIFIKILIYYKIMNGSDITVLIFSLIFIVYWLIRLFISFINVPFWAVEKFKETLPD